MAHELEIKENGTAAMAYLGDVPWHGLGKQLTEAEARSSRHVLEAAGLDWEVELARVRAETVGADGVGHTVDCQEARAVVRKDTGSYLGMVTDSYGCIQNREEKKRRLQILDGEEPEESCRVCRL